MDGSMSARQQVRHTKARGVSALGDAFETLMLVFLVAMLGFVSLLAMMTTAKVLDGEKVSLSSVFSIGSPDVTSPQPSRYLVRDAMPFDDVVVPILVGLLLLLVLLALVRVTRNVSLGTMLIVMFVFLMVVQSVWVVGLGQDSFHYSDTVRLDHMARDIVTTGDWSVVGTPVGVDSTPYLVDFPFQSGSLMLFVLVYSLFGAGNVVAFQLVNAVLNAIAALAVVGITGEMSHDDGTARTSTIMLMGFMPLVASCSFVYCNSAGMALSFVSLLVQCVAMRSTGTRQVALGALSMASMFLAIAVKGTCVLFLIPMAVMWVVFAIRHRSVLVPAMMVVLSVVASMGGSVAMHGLESRAGVILGDGMPKSSWLVIGTQYEADIGVPPGWWDGIAIKIWNDNGHDTQDADSEAKEMLTDNVSYYARDPKRALWFFVTKLDTEWAEPTYQSLYDTTLGYVHDTEKTTAFTGLIHDTSDDGHMARTVMDGGQGLLYVLALVGAVSMFRRRGGTARDMDSIALVSLSILAGFACYLLWEAKSVYMMPYAILMVPLASVGVSSIIDGFGRRHLRATDAHRLS